MKVKIKVLDCWNGLTFDYRDGIYKTVEWCKVHVIVDERKPIPEDKSLANFIHDVIKEAIENKKNMQGIVYAYHVRKLQNGEIRIPGVEVEFI